VFNFPATFPGGVLSVMVCNGDAAASNTTVGVSQSTVMPGSCTLLLAAMATGTTRFNYFIVGW
jgi:hypothetical protein